MSAAANDPASSSSKPGAASFAIVNAAAVLPTVWLIIRRADAQIVGDIGTHGPPDSQGCVEIGYSLAPSARGQGIGTAAVTAFIGCLAAVPGICRLTAVTGARNTASRRLLERQGFHLTGPLPGTDEVRYTLILTQPATR